ncbi:uncharacterized protein LOC144155654 isoform X1 [Haemaphysalis longicornis]
MICCSDSRINQRRTISQAHTEREECRCTGNPAATTFWDHLSLCVGLDIIGTMLYEVSTVLLALSAVASSAHVSNRSVKDSPDDGQISVDILFPAGILGTVFLLSCCLCVCYSCGCCCRRDVEMTVVEHTRYEPLTCHPTGYYHPTDYQVSGYQISGYQQPLVPSAVAPAMVNMAPPMHTMPPPPPPYSPPADPGFVNYGCCTTASVPAPGPQAPPSYSAR